jgi:hypothetical protein
MKHILLLTSLLALLASRVQAQSPAWFVIPGNYQYSATMVAALVVDSVLRTESNTIGIFVGNEVRGVGQPIPGSGGLYTITVYSNQALGETLSLKTYLVNENTVFPIQETFTFQANQVWGSVNNAQLLTVWTDGDVPISLDSLPAQQAIRPNQFSQLDLQPYLNQSDNDPVVWTANAGPNLIATLSGSTLSVQVPDPTWTGTSTVTVTATEQTSNQYQASRAISYTRLPGYFAPSWTTIPSQAIPTPANFEDTDLNAYVENTYQGSCLDFAFLVDSSFAGGSDPAPAWTINPVAFVYSMNVIGQAVYTPSYLFSHPGDRLAAFSGAQLVGLATPTSINDQQYFFLTVYSNTVSGNLNFRFYSAAKQKVYDIAEGLSFQPNASIGSVVSPQRFDAAPLRLTQNAENVLSVTRVDTAWTGYLGFRFVVTECNYPQLANDTTVVNFSVGLVEICDYIDNDYDMLIDEGLQQYFYADADGDGYGDPNADTLRCTAPAGYVSNDLDCDDSNANIRPGATELCDDIDNDCDGLLDEQDPGFVDLTPPIPTCKSTTKALSAQGLASLTPAEVYQSGSDDCGTVNLVSVVPNAFSCANVGNNTVTLTVNDGNGNTGTCTATVTVQDVTAPSAQCKAATVPLNAAGNGTLGTAQVNNNSSDNCGGSVTFTLSQTSFNCAHVGPNTVTLTVKDASNNTSTCTATVTVTDPVAPAALCKNATIFLDASGQAMLTAAQVNNNSTDACGVGAVSVSPSSFSCANIGGNQVQLTVVDVNGNASQCAALVTVSDNTPPVLACQNSSLALDNTGNAQLLPIQIYNAAGSSDNCGAVNLVSVSPSQFDCGEVGANTVTLSANDGKGNTSSCQATVTVTAFFPPMSAQVTPEVCGSEPGSITVVLTGASSSVQIGYSINGGATWQFNESFPGVSSGVYTVQAYATGTYACPSAPLTVAVPSTGATQQNTWTGGAGAIDSSWTNPANWSLGVVPTFCHDVVIPGGFDLVVPAGVNGVGSTLQVDLNATLTTQGAGTLTVQRF